MRRFLLAVAVAVGAGGGRPPAEASTGPQTPARELMAAIRYREFEAVVEAVRPLKTATGNEEAVELLVAALEAPGAEVRRRAAYALGELGPEAKGAIGALIKSFGDHGARAAAIAALGKIGPEAVPALLEALSSRSESTRSAASAALTQYRAAVGPQ